MDNFEWSELSDKIKKIENGELNFEDEFVPISKFRKEYKKLIEEKYLKRKESERY